MKATAAAHSENIPILKGQIESIDKDIQELKEKRSKLYEEWDAKWKSFNDQQNLITYIKNAEKKKENLLRAQQRQKEWEEKQKQLNVVKEVDSYGERIGACEWLIKYFSSQVAQVDQPQGNKQETVVTKEEDVKKAALKPLKKNEEEDFFALSESNLAKKKKEKGPKVSKREQEIHTAGFLVLDVSICNEVKKVGLNPPSKKSEVDKFVGTLNERLAEFRKLSEEEKKKFQEARNAQENQNASANSNEANVQSNQTASNN
jgi:hypothetical protein